MSDLHKSDPDSPYADDLEFVRDYARRNDGYSLVQPVVDFINAHLAPPIIRTVEELEAIDPDTAIEKLGTVIRTARQAINVAGHWGVGAVLPAVVVASGEHVRACREALEGETT